MGFRKAGASIFQLYDRIASKVVTPVRAPPSDAVQRARDAADALRELEHRRETDHRDLQELRDLLCRPHFKVRELNRQIFDQFGFFFLILKNCAQKKY